MNLNSIGIFQFDNLIKNRIPFLLINLTEKPLEIYSQTLYQQHLTKVEILTISQNVFSDLESRQYPKHEALLVLCHDGQVSMNLAKDLELKGFMNVFYVEGGLIKLKTDALR